MFSKETGLASLLTLISKQNSPESELPKLRQLGTDRTSNLLVSEDIPLNSYF